MFSTPQKTHFWPLPTADTFSTVAASLLIFTASDVFTCLLKVSFLPPPPNAFLLLLFLYSTTSLVLPVLHKKGWLFLTNHSYQSGYFFLPVGRLSINGITGQFFGSQLDFLCCWVLSSTFSFFFFCHQNLCFGLFVCLLSETSVTWWCWKAGLLITKVLQ